MITRCAGQLRFAPHGAAVLGLDLSAALSLGKALGYDLGALADPRIQSAGLAAAEAGLVAAINTRLSKAPS